MAGWFGNLYREIRPNFLYDVVKVLVIAGVSALVVVGYRLLSLARDIPQDRVIDAAIFVTAFCLLSAAYVLTRFANTRVEAGSYLSPKASQSASPPVVAPAPATARTIEPDEDGRIILDVTPEYLIGICKEHTAVQANKLLETYMGKWIRFSGKVHNVRSYSDSSMVVQVLSDNAFVSAEFTEQRWTDHVATFRRGTEIGVLGKLSKVDHDIVTLSECKLTN